MDDLSAYQARRLELGDMLRTLLHLVRSHDDQQRERAVRALLTRLASGRFQLAVAGQFSRGKPTLMNALLRDAYLPMGALPMTSVVTTVRYGRRPRGLVRSAAAGLPVEVPVAAGILPPAYLAVRPDGCPVCSALASTELDAAKHIAQQDPPPEALHLCLRHLARVLLAGPSVTAARAMTAGLAADLRRASQDMRAYALKRRRCAGAW
jgi:hypothetical protein